MARKKKFKALNLVLGIVGLLVTLSIGFSMIGGILILPTWLGGALVAKIVGWIVVIMTIIGAIMAIVKGLFK